MPQMRGARTRATGAYSDVREDREWVGNEADGVLFEVPFANFLGAGTIRALLLMKRHQRTSPHRATSSPTAAVGTIQLSPWSRVLLAAGTAYLLVHLGAYLLSQIGLIQLAATLAGLSLLAWSHLLEVVVTACVASWAAIQLIGATQDASEPALDLALLSGPREAVTLPLMHAVGTADVIGAAHRPSADVIRDLSLLYEMSQGISTTIDLQELLDRITDLLQRHFALREFAILLLADDSQTLHVRALSGFADEAQVLGMTFKVGEGVSGEAARAQRPMYIPDTSADPRFLHYHGAFVADGSFLAIPIMYKQEVLGVVNFGRQVVDGFSPNDLRLLSLVVHQMALAIANARLYSKTRELSVRDELTGLYNRRYFQDVLHSEWRRAKRFGRGLSVLMIDVDHFKSYNDTFGHLHGDYVLRQIADSLRRNLREVDTVARFGGEEFVVLLTDTDRQSALHVGEKLRRIVEHESFLKPQDGITHPITISIGIAVAPDDAKQVDDLVDHADIALYDAKDSGRNRVVCYPALDGISDGSATPNPPLVNIAES